MHKKENQYLAGGFFMKHLKQNLKKGRRDGRLSGTGGMKWRTR